MSSNSSIFEGVEDYLQPVYDVGSLSKEVNLTFPMTIDPIQNKQTPGVPTRPLVPIDQRPAAAAQIALTSGVAQAFDYQSTSIAWLIALTYMIEVVAGPAGGVFTVLVEGIVPSKPNQQLTLDSYSVGANFSQVLINYFGSNLLLNQFSKVRISVTADHAGAIIRNLPANDAYNLVKLNLQPHINNADYVFGSLRMG